MKRLIDTAPLLRLRALGAEVLAAARGVKLPADGLDYLQARGITAKTATACKLAWSTAAETKKAFGKQSAGLVIPYFDADGRPLLNDHMPFARARLLPKGGFQALADTFPKFIQKGGTKNHLYLCPLVNDWRAAQADPATKITITEGEFKAICANGFGILTVAIGGVWSWKTRINGISQPLPEMDEWCWQGRYVELAFDADASSKLQVRTALSALARELTGRGAIVRAVVLSALENMPNAGLDDYLVANGQAAYSALPREEVRLILSPGTPLDSAEAFRLTHHTTDGVTTLHRYQDSFHRWTGTCYPAVEDQAVRKEAYTFLSAAHQRVKDNLVPFAPTKATVDNLLDALRASTHLSRDEAPPCWLDGRTGPPATELIPCTNGLLHLPTGDLLPHSPRYFNLNALDFAHDPKATAKGWLAFLHDLWQDDRSAIGTFQEIAGYLLTVDTRQQKIFLIVGPKRSGKGTIARILTALLGKANVCAPTLASLGKDFGLQPLIGTQLAVISDARLSRQIDQHLLTERLLSISGEDNLTIDRKYKDAWTGQLATRFLILTNELPRLMDVSGALPSRFVLLQLTRSFYGKEDHRLTERLLAELPGILNWAIDGWKRLQARGYFETPRSSRNTLQEMEDLASPVGAFLRESCVEKRDAKVPCDELFHAWKSYCAERDQTYTGTLASFGRDLRAVVPGIERKQLRVSSEQRWFYTGIKLKETGKKRGKQRY